MSAPTSEQLLSGVRSGRWLDEQVFPPLRFAVPNLIPEGLSLLVAPPKAGKSWFVLSASLAAACGGAVLGHVRLEPRPVLYLALEDGHRRLQDRCRQLLGATPIPERFKFRIDLPPGATAAEVMRAWLDIHGDEQPLVVLDTLGRVAPPAMVGESAYARDYRVAAQYKAVADDYPGTALVAVHHVRKEQGGDFVDSVSGTHGIAGAADTILALTRPRMDAAGILRVTGRDLPEGEYALRFERGSEWVLDGRSFEEAARNAATVHATDGVGEEMSELVRYVSRVGRASPSDVAAALGWDPRKASTYLGRAVERGRLGRDGRGTYVPVLVALEVLYSDDPPPGDTNTPNTHNTEGGGQ